jgi:hypothetical protein
VGDGLVRLRNHTNVSVAKGRVKERRAEMVGTGMRAWEIRKCGPLQAFARHWLLPWVWWTPEGFSEKRTLGIPCLH